MDLVCFTFRHQCRFVITYRNEIWSHNDIVAKPICATRELIIFCGRSTN